MGAPYEIADAIDPTGGVGETVGSLKDSIGNDVTGDDVKGIGAIAKDAGEEMAAATKTPEPAPDKVSATNTSVSTAEKAKS